MAAGRFKLNKRTVGTFLKEDQGGIEAVDDAAEEIAAKAGPTASVETFTTDRHVAGVVVGAADQARDGVATRAAQAVSAENRGKARVRNGFRSRAQWRYMFVHDPAGAHEVAHASSRYSSLPERIPQR